MSKKKNKHDAAAKKARARIRESRAAEAATVAWLQCVLAAAVCEIAWAVTFGWVQWHPDSAPTAMLAGFFRFASLVSGVLGLLLTVVAHRTRRVAPPRSVTRFAIGIGLIAVAIFVAPWFRE